MGFSWEQFTISLLTPPLLELRERLPEASDLSGFVIGGILLEEMEPRCSWCKPAVSDCSSLCCVGDWVPRGHGYSHP